MSVWIISALLQFATQITLILIFLEIGKRNPFKVEERVYSTDGMSHGQRSQTVKFEFKENSEQLKHFIDDESTVKDGNLLDSAYDPNEDTDPHKSSGVN